MTRIIRTVTSYYKTFVGFDRTEPYHLYRKVKSAAIKNIVVGGAISLMGGYASLLGFETCTLVAEHFSKVKFLLEKCRDASISSRVPECLTFLQKESIYDKARELVQNNCLTENILFPSMECLVFFPIAFMVLAGGIKLASLAKSLKTQNPLEKKLDFNLMKNKPLSLACFSMALIYPSALIFGLNFPSFLMGAWLVAESFYWGLTFSGVNVHNYILKFLGVRALQRIANRIIEQKKDLDV